MGQIKRFEEIEAWKEACILANRIYELSDMGSFSKDFGLRDQMRRAVVSILSNIAEGYAEETRSFFNFSLMQKALLENFVPSSTSLWTEDTCPTQSLKIYASTGSESAG